MDPAMELRAARLRSGCTQRELAMRSGTSQAAVSAYETGAKSPSVATLSRLLEACGSELVVTHHGLRWMELEQSGDRLRDVLGLAEAVPFRRSGPLTYPRLPVA